MLIVSLRITTMGDTMLLDTNHGLLGIFLSVSYRYLRYLNIFPLIFLPLRIE
jgi:hypothetical protein